MVALLPLFVLSAFFFSSSRSEGNITCADSGLDWYTNVAGETPCRTYERLRQICNSAYEVGTLNPNTPPDTCNEQVPDCCCNSISFALSMLCLNCQQGIGKGTGIDAGKGAYQLYLENGKTTFCSPNTNQSFPSSIQSAVCNDEIKIYDALYGLFWTDGSWFYEYTSQTITKDIASTGNNSFTHCNSTLLNATSSSTSSSATSTSISTNGASPTSEGSSASGTTTTATSFSSSSLGSGPIAGIAIGSATGVLAAALALWFLWWKRKKLDTRPTAGQAVLDVDPFLGGRNHSGDLDSPPMAQPYSYSPYSHQPSASFSASAFSGSASGLGSTSRAGSNTGAAAGHGARYNSSPGKRSGRNTQSPSHSAGAPSTDFSSSVSSAAAFTGGATSSSARNNADVDVSTRERPLPNPSSSNAALSPQSETSISTSQVPERHTDAGPVAVSMLERQNSGRLPPAYGEQFG